MFGFVIGTLCLFGLVGMVRRSAYHHACQGDYARHGGHGHRGWGPHGGRRRRRGRRGSMSRVAAEVLKRKLDIDEDQEGIVDHAVADLRETLSEVGGSLKESRSEIAEAFRGDEVDDAALAAIFDRQDEELRAARRQIVSSLKQIHAVLDDEQRDQAADLLGTAKGWV